MLPAAAGVGPQAVNPQTRVSPIEANYGQEEQETGSGLPVQYGAAGNGIGLAGGSGGSLPVGKGMGGLGNGPVVTSETVTPERRSASVRGALPAPAFSTTGNAAGGLPVFGAETTSLPLSDCLPPDSKEVTSIACTDIGEPCTDLTVDSSMPAQAQKQQNACTETIDCPPLECWRQAENQPPVPRSFSCVSHLRLDVETVESDLTVRNVTITGWQFQWSTNCIGCGKRYRPVVGFLSARAQQRLLEVDEDEQRNIVSREINRRFNRGKISRRHPRCTS